METLVQTFVGIVIGGMVISALFVWLVLPRMARYREVQRPTSAQVEQLVSPQADGAPRHQELRRMDDRSLEYLIAQHLGWHWELNPMPGFPPVLLPPGVAAGNMGHVVPNYLGDPAAAWTLLCEHTERTGEMVDLILLSSLGETTNGRVLMGKTDLLGPLPRAIGEAWVIEREKSHEIETRAPSWIGPMAGASVPQFGGEAGTSGRQVQHVGEAAPPEQDGPEPEAAVPGEPS